MDKQLKKALFSYGKGFFVHISLVKRLTGILNLLDIHSGLVVKLKMKLCNLFKVVN